MREFPNKQCNQDWLLHHDNLAAYMVLTVLHFLSENSVVWVIPPPLLP